VKGSVFKRCGCRGPETGKHYGSRCPKLKGKNHGRWFARYDAPPGADGKRRRRRIGPYHTKGEAEAALREALGRVDTGTYVDSGRETFGDYLEGWLDSKVKLSANTRQSYREHVRLYLKPGLGHIRLTELRERDFEALYAAMRKLGPPRQGRPSDLLARLLEVRHDGVQAQRPLSPARIRRIHATASSALGTAKKRGIIARHPAENVELESGKAPKPLVWTAARVAQWERDGKRPSKVMVWTPEQTGAFLDFAAGDELYALWHLIAFGGLRRGEAINLRWSETVLDKGTATIRPQDDDGDAWTPKSESSARTISLDAGTVEALREHRKTQVRTLHGEPGRVFTRGNGAALNPESVSQKFDRLIERYQKIRREHVEEGLTEEQLITLHFRTPRHAIRVAVSAPLPPIRLHDLRHVAASLAYRATRDLKLVSERMGHSSIGITGDIYTSLFEDVHHDVADKAAALVPRRTHPIPNGPTLAPPGPSGSGSGRSPTHRKGLSPAEMEARPAGFEPATLGLEVRRSIR